MADEEAVQDEGVASPAAPGVRPGEEVSAVASAEQPAGAAVGEAQGAESVAASESAGSEHWNPAAGGAPVSSEESAAASPDAQTVANERSADDVPAENKNGASSQVSPSETTEDKFAEKRPGMFTRFIEAVTGRKRRRLEKIVRLAETRYREAREPGAGRVHRPQGITNDDVEKLLRVSDATATRYLAELVRAGRLRRVGSPERAQYEIVQ